VSDGKKQGRSKRYRGGGKIDDTFKMEGTALGRETKEEEGGRGRGKKQQCQEGIPQRSWETWSFGNKLIDTRSPEVKSEGACQNFYAGNLALKT